MEDREKDIQKLCEGILELSIHSTGDSGTGGECPFCFKECNWDANNVSEIDHELNCIVLIAKDLTTRGDY